MTAVVLATAGYDHKIRFWEASSRVCTRTVRYPDSQVNCLAISDDKLFLAAGGNPHVRVFDVAHAQTSAPVAEFSHAGNATSCGFCRDRSWLFSSSEDGTVKVWDLRAPPNCKKTFACTNEKGESVAVNSACLRKGGDEIISGDDSGAVRVWDVTADRCRETLRPTDGAPIRAVACATDGSFLACATRDADVYVYRPDESDAHELDHIIEAAHDAGGEWTYILACRVSPDSRLLVTTASDKTAKIWNAARGFALEKTLAQHQRWVWDACFSADSAYLVTASSDHSARLWDLSSGAAIRYYSGHSLAVTCCALNDSSAA
jgi:G protein beta subunit-like protein